MWSCLLHRALRRCSRHTKAYSSFPSGHTILRLSSSCFRRHLVTYHGVLAPGASLRYRVVPQGDEDGDQDELDEDCAAPEAARSDEAAAGSEAPPVARVPHRPGKWRRAVRRYYTWAELLRRVFGVEIFTCPNCGGARRLLAAIKDPDSIERVLRAVGLPFDVPELAVARAPPDGGGGWLGA